MVRKIQKTLGTFVAVVFAFSLAAQLDGENSPLEVAAVEKPINIVTPQAESRPPSEPKEATEEPVEAVDFVQNVEESVSTDNIKKAEEVAESPNETIFTTMTAQSGAPWGLDALDGTRDGTYNYLSDGLGVRIYIVDTGVDATHREFGSRVVDGFDAFGQNLDQTDCNGHGTHVAAIAGGSYYGAAKAATIVPVRVMDCSGVGNTTTLTDGIDWILASHPGGVGIVNMSIGGNKDQEVNNAVSELINAGLVVVAAAGNSNADACNYSPGSAQGVIAVGATDQSNLKASFSNWGSCVDVSAPGVRINSANASDHNVSLRMSGTSQASPFVAGAIATYLSSGSVTSPSQAEPYLRELAVDGIARVETEPAPLPEPTPEPIVEPEPELVEPEPSESPVVDTPIVPDPEEAQLFVRVTQSAIGSGRAVLEWSQLDQAEGYKIYKTSSIRPGWRQYASVSQAAYYRNVIDKPGSIAIYRVVAIISGKEVEIGTFEYFPE